MKLIDKIKKVNTKSLALAGLVGIIGIAGEGCDTLDNAFSTGSGYNINAAIAGANANIQAQQGNARAANAWGALGNILEGESQHQYRMEEAQESKSQVNINIQQNQEQPQQQQKVSYGATGYSTAFLYFKDKDGDGEYSSPAELEGANKSFSLSNVNAVKFASRVQGYAGGSVNMYLYLKSNMSGEIISESWVHMGYDNAMVTFTLTSEKLRNAGANGKCFVNFRVKKESDPEPYGIIYDGYPVNFDE